MHRKHTDSHSIIPSSLHRQPQGRHTKTRQEQPLGPVLLVGLDKQLAHIERYASACAYAHHLAAQAVLVIAVVAPSAVAAAPTTHRDNDCSHWP
eukprot:CAMPEP_0114423888 /NCGR_PEP_ID=MMETSP0103-20121206/6394_1 /TAXON_ID=37642 ORGANISM="Paraphysomonas imperforata, Strain PA2" /NCGR_SAMPLE_ID=MMETSP0103 /ASSEMBLY_ACC=CAM_ASM_000201 /LENGTH=93 /DNA_ID=CAMNT_0001592591 /DNA_START=156 /DNA_END=434 /DNA_ORIENTATION=-